MFPKGQLARRFAWLSSLLGAFGLVVAAFTLVTTIQSGRVVEDIVTSSNASALQARAEWLDESTRAALHRLSAMAARGGAVDPVVTREVENGLAEMVEAADRLDALVAATALGPAARAFREATRVAAESAGRVARALPADPVAAGRDLAALESGRAGLERARDSVRAALREASGRAAASVATRMRIGVGVELVLVITVVLLGLGFASLVHVGILGPIGELAAAVDPAKRGQGGTEALSRRDDEIGTLSRALDSFAAVSREREAEAVQRADKLAAEARRKEAAERAADEFGQHVSRLVTDARIISASMREASGTLANLAATVRTEADAVARSSSRGADTMRVVARAATELAQSTAEIRQKSRNAADLVTRAVVSTRDAEAGGADLEQAATSVGRVVDVIRSVAEQTNLLALNATIEAARAGDAGRGFAVVANEVKNLAHQTAHSTDEIARRVEQIRASVSRVGDRMRAAGGAADQMEEVTIAIAAAAEEQAATTQDLANAVGYSADEVTLVSESFAKMLDSIEKGDTTAALVDEIAGRIVEQASALSRAVDTFTRKMAA